MGGILLVDPTAWLLDALRVLPHLAGYAVERAAGGVDAIRRLRRQACDVVVTSPATSVEEDLAFLDEVRLTRPGVRAIVLAPRAAPEEVIAALRAQVFAMFTEPLDHDEVAGMIRRAAQATDRADGIQVISAQPNWIAVRVNCALLTAERLVRFLSELRKDVPAADREGLLLALREVLINAIEHGAGLDPKQVVEVAAVRTERAIVYYVKDPGSGFDPSLLAAAGAGDPPGDAVALALARAEAGLSPAGFGLLLTRQVMDEMIHSEQANEVLLIKHTR